jgi:putative transposase
MTLPRQVVPGCDYMVTRRCSERRFFLRPDDETNNAFVYCLALAAQRAKVQVTFTIAMSNHHHTGIHDPEGNFPAFIEYFHGLLARCQNAHLGRFENFWSSEPTSAVRLVEPNDILDKMVYAFINPVAADLVDRVEEWPGVTSFNATLSGGQLVARRPKHFFRNSGELPEVVELPIHRPVGLKDLSPDDWAKLLEERVRDKESRERVRRTAQGIRVLGHRGVLSQRPFDCPNTHAPRFQMSPRVAAKSKWARIEALLRNRAFVEKYRDAFMRYVAGVADVLFPFGTYLMRKIARVPCEGADTMMATSASPAAPEPASG